VTPSLFSAPPSHGLFEFHMLPNRNWNGQYAETNLSFRGNKTDWDEASLTRVYHLPNMTEAEIEQHCRISLSVGAPHPRLPKMWAAEDCDVQHLGCGVVHAQHLFKGKVALGLVTDRLEGQLRTRDFVAKDYNYAFWQQGQTKFAVARVMGVDWETSAVIFAEGIGAASFSPQDVPASLRPPTDGALDTQIAAALGDEIVNYVQLSAAAHLSPQWIAAGGSFEKFPIPEAGTSLMACRPRFKSVTKFAAS
jgi:hypothetical protein